MSDAADNARKEQQRQDEAIIENAKNKAASFEEGQPGNCDGCGDNFERVVPRKHGFMKGLFCGKCRDELNLN